MKPLCILLAAVLAAATVGAAEKKKKESGWTKVLRTMFPSAKPKIVPKKKKRVVAQAKQTLPKPKHVPVEIDWMARYWEEEAAWDYYIPEDDQIRFENGKYYVPIVVYRHYEDMVNTPRRTPTPKPVYIEG